MTTGERLIDVKQLSAKLSKAPRTLFRWAKDKVIPAGVVVGGSRVWREKEIDEWIANGAKPLSN